jgi:hypothetical protein
MQQKNILSIIFLFFLCLNFPQDSTTVNKRYDLKQARLQQQYDARVQELLKTDPLLNQLKGASQQLEIERAEALKNLDSLKIK